MNDPKHAFERNLEQLSTLFRLLADQTRLSILMALVKGERNVGSLCQEMGLPQPTVSHHLALLRTHSIVHNRRDGKQVFYSLTNQRNPGELLAFVIGDFDVKVLPQTSGNSSRIAAPASDPAVTEPDHPRREMSRVAWP